MPKIKPKEFRVRTGQKVSLKDWPTDGEPCYSSKSDYHKILSGQTEALSDLQSLLYADNRYSLLLIFQGMDASGKDGAIKAVMSGVNPQGCEVFSFKTPSSEELAHDFLWRETVRLPRSGRIGIHNRSYYEEVLVARVHPKVLHGEGLPDEVLSRATLWADRYRSIRELEAHLSRNGTRIIKFFLHMSHEEQRKRFLERIDDPQKHWKFVATDLEDRKYWKQYMSAYESCIHATSSDHAPWYIVPADDKKSARLIISEIIVDTMRGMKLSYPETTDAHRKELQAMRKQLVKK
jgi:PPK2 family polyphosphate:nucleotide phosphotransferase